MGTPVFKLRLAEWVFDQLAAEILERRVSPGDPLPSEELLAARFGVSRMIMRQAIHRLEDVGLIIVRQGLPTRVLDLTETHDLRILELIYRLAPSAGPALVDPADVIEKQFLQGFALIDIAERRAPDDALAPISELVASFAAAPQSEAAFVAFEERFWQAVARAGKNRILQMETNWWYRVLSDRPRPEAHVPSLLAARVAFYVELARRLRAREGAARYYHEAVTPILTALMEKKP
jgi:DNA-binding FadR family transcriptional regulator